MGSQSSVPIDATDGEDPHELARRLDADPTLFPRELNALIAAYAVRAPMMWASPSSSADAACCSVSDGGRTVAVESKGYVPIPSSAPLGLSRRRFAVRLDRQPPHPPEFGVAMAGRG